MLDKIARSALGATVVAAVLFSGVYFVSALNSSVTYTKDNKEDSTIVASTSPEVLKEAVPAWPLLVDKEEYDKRLLVLSDYVPPKLETIIIPATASSTATTTRIMPPSPLVYNSATNVLIKGKSWPASAPYPQGGAILPFQRILAYYGNFYSRKMGVLGEYEPAEVIRRLANTRAEWEAADPNTPVLPAIEYIAMVAQADGGADGMYRAVMPDAEIEKAYALAQEVEGILIMDIQTGLSPIEKELPKFKKYLIRPDVHFAIDPEFSMKSGDRPGTVVGTYDAKDINYVINYLSDIVRENELPPKVLLVHRFTQNMVTGSSRIAPTPEVQVVMVMDGWGSKDLKRGTYANVIVPEPVQFTGVKLFYKNDLKPPSTGLLTPAEVLSLHPKPIYIQYQ
jgi:hypothetical protein